MDPASNIIHPGVFLRVMNLLSLSASIVDSVCQGHIARSIAFDRAVQGHGIAVSFQTNCNRLHGFTFASRLPETNIPDLEQVQTSLQVKLSVVLLLLSKTSPLPAKQIQFSFSGLHSLWDV